MVLCRLIKPEREPVSSISFPQRSCRVSGFAFFQTEVLMRFSVLHVHKMGLLFWHYRHI